MTEPTDPAPIVTFEIEFPVSGRAVAVEAGPRTPPHELTAALGISGPRSVLLVIGGADGLPEDAGPALRELIDSGALAAAETTDALVVDGGTAAGIMAIVGEASAAHPQLALLGVAPRGKVTWPGDPRSRTSGAAELEPNHTHFILTRGDAWGDETPLLMETVEELADPSRVVALLVGGGAITRRELASAVGRGIPVVAIGGSRGLADELAAEVGRPGGRSAQPEPKDAALAAIAEVIELAVVPLDASPAVLERTLLRRLRPDETLEAAGQQYRTLARAARSERRSFIRYQLGITALGVAATTLVVIQAQLQDDDVLIGGSVADQALQYMIVLIPIAVGVLVAGAARLRPGGRWVLLRGAAETIKSELYRYRTRTGVYAARATRRTPREVKLATAIGATMNALMLTDVNLSALDHGTDGASVTTPTTPTSDKRAADGALRPLDADGYIQSRINDQLAFYRRGVRSRERRVRALRWLTLGFGGLGTFLAVIGLQLWVAVAVAVVGAVTTSIEALQLESTITLYNQAATSLDAIKSWWVALPPAEQVQRRNFDRLVDRSERVMQAEHVGWVQEMQDALTTLHLEERDEPPGHEGAEQSDRPANDEAPDT